MKVLAMILAFAALGTAQDFTFPPNSTADFKPRVLCMPIKNIVSVSLGNGLLEVVTSVIEDPCTITFPSASASTGQADRRIWKETYGVKNGQIVLLKKVEGKIIPEHVVRESIEWPQ